MLAGSAAVHIRWVPHLCGHPVVQQPPCFPASTGPLRRRRRRRRLAAAYRPLLINYDYTCGGTHICIHSATPIQICCGTAHVKHTHFHIISHSWGIRRKSERGSLRGIDRLAAWLPMETTYGSGTCWWDDDDDAQRIFTETIGSGEASVREKSTELTRNNDRCRGSVEIFQQGKSSNATVWNNIDKSADIHILKKLDFTVTAQCRQIMSGYINNLYSCRMTRLRRIFRYIKVEVLLMLQLVKSHFNHFIFWWVASSIIIHIYIAYLRFNILEI